MCTNTKIILTTGFIICEICKSQVFLNINNNESNFLKFGVSKINVICRYCNSQFLSNWKMVNYEKIFLG